MRLVLPDLALRTGPILGGSFIGALDTLPASAGAWSLRKMRSAYAGSCVRVRRSLDNAEADIGFKLYAPRTYPYWIDEDALLAHVGAGNGFVTTWYDQSGLARHATQAVAGNQPSIVTAGVIERLNGMPVLKFNGTSSSMRTPLINLTATDKITVSAVQRKLSDAIAALLCEFSANLNTNSGSFFVATPITSGTSNYAFRTNGISSAVSNYTDAAVTAPHTGVLTGIGDISGDRATLRVNGTQVVQSLADQGTGNYGNYNLFIGARNYSSLWYNGLLGELILFPSNLGTPDLATLETGQIAAWGITS